MDQPRFAIERGLPERLRDRAAEILDEAFAEKLSPVIPDRDRRLAFLARTIRARNCITARDGEDLLGLVCLNAPHGEFEGEVLDTSALGIGGWRSMLGTLGAIRAALMLHTFYSHKAKPDEVYIDFIAVAAAARGRGVGSRLLAEARGAAGRSGLGFVRLDVVDTNPRAQALYEREGYRVVREERLGFLGRFTGFSVAYTMELPAGPDEAPVSWDGRPNANR